MKWSFDNDRAIYAQIISQMRLFIASGALPPGSKLKSVRELAAEAGVNPNTMQKALTELERLGLVYASRTSGRFVTEDDESIAAARSELAESMVGGLLDDMKKLGYNTEDVIKFIDGRKRK